MKFAVCVTFEVFPDHREDFLRRVIDNATVSLDAEPGCLQFDVCTDGTVPNEVFLYETYATSGAFDDHLGSSHFKNFNAETSDMIKSKTVKTYQVVQ